jgi:NADH-quinone oxidoreductase subunit G
MTEKINTLSKAKNVIWLQSPRFAGLDDLKANVWIIPMKSYVEKEGTFINYAGLAQSFKRVTNVVSEALTLAEAGELLVGHQLMIKPEANALVEADRPEDRVMLEHRKKNEYVFRRGEL